MAFVNDVKRALEIQLNTYATTNDIRVSWESSDFEPIESEVYLDPTFLPAPPIQRELMGVNTKDRFTGLYQINIVQKKGMGTADIDVQADLLNVTFNRGITLEYTTTNDEDVLVEILKCYIGRLNEDSPPWAYKPVYIEWRSDIWVGIPT